MRVIYQIGRLDSNMEELDFSVDGRTFRAPLSSLALKKYFGDQTQVILLYPVSLPINERLLKSSLDDNLKFKIKWVLENPSDYLTNPKEFFQHHPHSKLVDDYTIIHSLGTFGNLEFNANFDLIVLEIFAEIVNRYLNSKFSELYVDISSGHNIYVSALIEAARNFLVFQRLQNWSDSDEMIVKFIFSDPIIGSSKREYEIHYDYELKLKVFFSSPIDKSDLDSYNLSRAISGDDKKFKNEIQQMLTNFMIAFSAIKNNTPLVLYSFTFDEISKIVSAILRSIEKIKTSLSSNWLAPPQLIKDSYIKLLLTLSFYQGILKTIEKVGIIHKREVELDEILSQAKKVYQIFNLNLHYGLLKHEIRNLKNGKDQDGKTLLEKAKENWQRLSEFLFGESREIVPRNFLAHAGFERNSLELKKSEKGILVRYHESTFDRIKDILLNS